MIRWWVRCRILDILFSNSSSSSSSLFLHFLYPIGYQCTQFFRRALNYAIYIYIYIYIIYIYIYIYSHMIQGGTPRGRTIQYWGLNTNGYWCIINLGLMIHQHSTKGAKKSFYIKTKKKKKLTFFVSLWIYFRLLRFKKKLKPSLIQNSRKSLK